MLHGVEKRITEVTRLGYKKVFLGRAQLVKLKKENSDIELIGISNVLEMMNILIGGRN